jgi:AAA domain, putative AbiEii toxin, Type IV TA system/AAA ATPase domain
MWLRELRVKNLKRLRDFTLDLRAADGEPRRWTVIIGPNGTGKTSLLQAAALAAAGNFRADDLVKDLRDSLPDKRQEIEEKGPRGGVRKRYAEVDIAADFVFGPIGRAALDVHPLRNQQDALGGGEVLRSRLSVSPDRPVAGNARYVDAAAFPLEEAGDPEDPTLAPDRSGDRDTDPLVAAREDDLPLWFVAGYGVQRDLPEDALTVSVTKPASIDRLRALFGPRQLIGPNFQALFEKDMSLEYADLLRDVLMHTKQLVPGIEHIELRGRGGVSKPEDLTKGHRFVQRVAGVDLKLPARWLSHGYQSSLAWVADLVGQVMLEGGSGVGREHMEGLVLIDEIDLYLHPKWQVGLIQALRETLPNMQFIATTHSPILLSAFHRDEVVMLDFDDDGNVVQEKTPRDPRLLTGSELYELFFGIDKLYPAELGERLERYTRLATDPYRTEEEDATARWLLEELQRDEIDPGIPLSVRRHRNQVG